MTNYRIYQIESKAESAHGFMFSSLGMLDRLGLRDKMSLDNYDMVYEGIMDGFDLEKLFMMFQGRKPEGFKGHSLSVSDVVEVNGDFFYCDSYKWEKITFPKKETTDKPYKVVTWNFRAKHPNKPHFFKTDDEALLFGNSQVYNSRVEIVEYFHLENGEWIKY